MGRARSPIASRRRRSSSTTVGEIGARRCRALIEFAGAAAAAASTRASRCTWRRPTSSVGCKSTEACARCSDSAARRGRLRRWGAARAALEPAAAVFTAQRVDGLAEQAYRGRAARRPPAAARRRADADRAARRRAGGRRAGEQGDRRDAFRHGQHDPGASVARLREAGRALARPARGAVDQRLQVFRHRSWGARPVRFGRGRARRPVLRVAYRRSRRRRSRRSRRASGEELAGQGTALRYVRSLFVPTTRPASSCSRRSRPWPSSRPRSMRTSVERFVEAMPEL